MLGKGDGLAKIEGNRNDLERFQSPLLTLKSKKEIEIYVELKKLFDGIEVPL
ncbi:hypothetical protein [Neobacillus drentensis]|uniref:hypothetical protein n=1 Tax=Neobacillus drentensis TaxID=220684 RepID=UPI002FFD63CC